MQLEHPSPDGATRSLDDLATHYDRVRRLTVRLCEPLSPEDMVLQSMTQASPAKWHLAHTTWFFETFLLAPHQPGYRPYDARFGYLFNSYYNSVGERVARDRRGMLSRPGVGEVLAYRDHVDAAMRQLLDDPDADAAVAELTVLGLNHEQQHQELLLTDIKHAFSLNPLRPEYTASGGKAPPHPRPSKGPPEAGARGARAWLDHPGGLCEIGHDGAGFAFDNEGPRHRVFLQPFRLAARLVSCGDYQAFLADGGYDNPALWLSDGWEARCRLDWTAPLYWEHRDGAWWQFSLAGGMRPVADDEPVCHLSYYEADAFARWAEARLPTEAEWEVAAAGMPADGSFLDGGRLEPSSSGNDAGAVAGLFGEVWQWTGSAYLGYPGYRPPAGALGEYLAAAMSEYNAKFFTTGMVLRGGSCFTPRDHFRVTYRNFFSLDSRWQMTGIRLAQDA